MDYSLFETDDFVANESFQSYHFKKNEYDINFWVNWVKDHPEKKQEIEKAENILSLMAATYQNDITNSLSGNYKKIRNNLVNASSKSNTGAKLIGSNYIKRVAAIFLLLIIATIATYQYLNKEKAFNYIVKSTVGGQKSTLILNDGSKVVMNSESTLKYPAEFSDSSRELFMEGEIFFEVAKDKSRPFIVRSGDITTIALGTSFNISTFPDNNVTQVALVTGRVKVVNYKDKPSKRPVILSPGEAIFYNKENFKMRKGQFSSKEVLSWKDDILYFNDAEFDEIKRKLERWYGVEITITGKERKIRHFTGEFENENLANVLELLSHSRGFKYSISGHKVAITFN